MRSQQRRQKCQQQTTPYKNQKPVQFVTGSVTQQESTANFVSLTDALGLSLQTHEIFMTEKIGSNETGTIGTGLPR